MKIPLLNIRFANDLSPHEVPLFRGAVVAALDNKLLLFHNHNGDEGLRYRYPLIQYKRIGGRAAIVCIGEGTEQIGELFATSRYDLKLGERSMSLELDTVQPMTYNMQVWQQLFAYRITRWLPLNSANYAKFRQLESLADRYAMLEGLLTANILSMAKGIGLRMDERIECHITAMSGDPSWVRVKGVKVLAFNLEFSSNVSLPPYIGLGKHVSLGFGVVTRHRVHRGHGNMESIKHFKEN